MNWFLFLKLFHILLFVFWLGTDMGTFYSSKFVINPKLSAPQRATALQILLGCDLGPRIAMPLITPTGIHMAFMIGLVKISDLGLMALWGFSLLWLTLVLALHFSKNETQKKKLKAIDYWSRIVIVIAIGSFAIYSLMNPTIILAPYLNYKLLIVCALILFGLGIRYHLSRFTPAFINLMQSKDIDNANAIMTKRMGNCMPYVYGIWIGTTLNAALGLHLIG
ncbi:hypothetical protein [uncultured Croceitalea sp.]|uniref:hypothetical protein n=1 Tax=uncultured Croceitalea sp. TaxID=1798908 RepID=UPI00374EC9B9